MFEAFHVMQHEHSAAPVRQIAERAVEVHAIDHTHHGTGAAGRQVVNRRRVIEFARQLRVLVRPAPQMVQTHIGGQAVEPGPERGVAAVLVQLPVRREEDVLEEVLAVMAARHAAGEAEETGGVRSIEFLERQCIARLAPGGQLYVGMGLHVVNGLDGNGRRRVARERAVFQAFLMPNFRKSVSSLMTSAASRPYASVTPKSTSVSK